MSVTELSLRIWTHIHTLINAYLSRREGETLAHDALHRPACMNHTRYVCLHVCVSHWMHVRIHAMCACLYAYVICTQKLRIYKRPYAHRSMWIMKWAYGFLWKASGLNWSEKCWIKKCAYGITHICVHLHTVPCSSWFNTLDSSSFSIWTHICVHMHTVLCSSWFNIFNFRSNQKHFTKMFTIIWSSFFYHGHICAHEFLYSDISLVAGFRFLLGNLDSRS